MTIEETGIKGLRVIIPEIYRDNRGVFMETYNSAEFAKHGINYNFCQDNESSSTANVVRGLHLQRSPYAQAKLVRVSEGAILDVAVDLRPNSKTFLKHFSVMLSDVNKKMLLIPEGFAHGFSVISQKGATVNYKCSNHYSKGAEVSILWNDPDLNINWGIIGHPIVSDRDFKALTLKQYLEEEKSLWGSKV